MTAPQVSRTLLKLHHPFSPLRDGCPGHGSFNSRSQSRQERHTMAEGRSLSHTRATGSAHSTPHLDSSSVQSRSPPASPRLSSARNSIRRKPAPSVQGDGDAHSTREHGGEGEETLRELGVDTARSPAMRRGNSAGSGSDYGYSMPPSPASASAYAFPPQPRRTGSASSVPHISAIPTYAYNSNTPGGMTAATRSPHPSTSRETLESTGRPPRITTRASQHSQRGSMAQGNGSGSAPRGVIGKSRPKEVVRIERDYSEGELCQFWSGWIWELEGRVSLPFSPLYDYC